MDQGRTAVCYSYPTLPCNYGHPRIDDFSEITGGRTFTLDNPADLPAVARAIWIQLRHQYLIGYRPRNSARNGKWHKIKAGSQP